MQVKCHRTIPALTWTKRLKAFHPWGKMLSPCIYLYSGCYGFFKCPYRAVCTSSTSPLWRTSPGGAWLHWWACTARLGALSPLPGERHPRKKNTYMEMQLKSLFLWIVQAVLRDSGRKCSVRATWRGDGQRDEGPRWLRSTPSAFPIRKPPVLHPSLRHSVLIQRSKSDETHFTSQDASDLFIVGLHGRYSATCNRMTCSGLSFIAFYRFHTKKLKNGAVYL